MGNIVNISAGGFAFSTTGKEFANAIGEQIQVMVDDCRAYLVEFLEYCQQEHLDNVVFVNFPRYIQHEEKSDLLSRVNDIQTVVLEYGFDFLNLQKEIPLWGISFYIRK